MSNNIYSTKVKKLYFFVYFSVTFVQIRRGLIISIQWLNNCIISLSIIIFTRQKLKNKFYFYIFYWQIFCQFYKFEEVLLSIQQSIKQNSINNNLFDKS